MTPAGRAGVPIEVELAPALGRAIVQRSEVQPVVGHRIDERMRRMGVPGRSQVQLREARSPRMIRVRVNGRVQPYPAGVLARAWQRVAEPDDAGVPFLQQRGDAAIADASWVEGAAERLEDATLAGDFVTEAVFQIVTRRPQALLGRDQVDAYARANGIAPQRLAPIGRFLLGLGVSIRDAERLRATIESLSAKGLPDADIAETAFDRLRARRVEIHCQPAYMTGVVGGDPLAAATSVHSDQFTKRATAAFADVERRLYDAIGLRTPELTWVPDRDIEAQYVTLRINDRPSPPVRAPRAGMDHVDAPAEEVRRLVPDAEPYYDPLRRAQCSLVPQGSEAPLTEHGLAVRTPAEWIAEHVHHELRARAGHVLGVEDVEYHLARLEDHHSDIVTSVVARSPLGDITRILRALLREGHSIKDMLTIVERLVAYDEVEVGSLADMVFDSRFPVTEELCARPRWVRQFEFVRGGVAPLIVTKKGQALNALEVLRIDPVYEDLADRVAYQPPGMLRSWLDDDAQGELCDRVRAAVRGLDVGDVPVVLTRRSARAGIREVLATELPELTVLAHEDILPGTRIRELEAAAV